ncbi:MAG: hypothetical protein JRF29_03270 [Deltaproteobacteria bacterium]|nr:hypothetical protein [Deltaproteobacteria bacterium]
MDDKLRLLMIWITFALLALLAGVESALAFMSDQIAQNMEALRRSLGGGLEQSVMVTSMIPTIGQMIIGFILPFALVFVAVPIESFVSSSRTVLGIIIAAVLRFLAFLLRLIGNAGYFAARLIVNIYDLLIFPSIWLEGVIVGSKTKNDDTSEELPYKDITITEETIDKINDPLDYTEQHESK